MRDERTSSPGRAKTERAQTKHGLLVYWAWPTMRAWEGPCCHTQPALATLMVGAGLWPDWPMICGVGRGVE